MDENIFVGIPVQCTQAIVIDEEIESFENIMIGTCLANWNSSSVYVVDYERNYLEINRCSTIQYMSQINAPHRLVYAMSEFPNFFKEYPLMLPYKFIITNLPNMYLMYPIHIGLIGQNLSFHSVKYVKINNSNLKFVKSPNNGISTLECYINKSTVYEKADSRYNKLIICIDNIIYDIPIHPINIIKIQNRIPESDSDLKKRINDNHRSLLIGYNQKLY